MQKITNLERLCGAVGVYKHDARTTKNQTKKDAYKAIKKLYDGLSFFEDNQNLSCGALFPYMYLNNTEVVMNLQKIIKKISDLTNENYHTEAIIVLAEYLKETKAVKILEHILKIHLLVGHMPRNLMDFRTSILTDLIIKVRDLYGEEVKDKIRMAF